MNSNARRLELQSSIMDLVEARDNADTEAQKEALLEQIEALEQMVTAIDLGEADALGGKIDAVLEKLDEILNAQPLDAASALGRAANRLRGLVQGQGGNG